MITVLHTPMARPARKTSLQSQLKMFLLRYTKCYAVSRYLQTVYPNPTSLISNPHNRSVFKRLPECEASPNLLFVGRLTAAKGCKVAIDVLAVLHKDLRSAGREPFHLDIVGSGEEEPALRNQITASALRSMFTFWGRNPVTIWRLHSTATRFSCFRRSPTRRRPFRSFHWRELRAAASPSEATKGAFRNRSDVAG
jgi:glycosyltransferase involved in cell wall biosynthesis